MVVTVSSKGQIVIPAELRHRYGIEAGDRYVVVDFAGRIYLVPAVDDAIAAAEGMLKGRRRLATTDLREERRRDLEHEEGEFGPWRPPPK